MVSGHSRIDLLETKFSKTSYQSQYFNIIFTLIEFSITIFIFWEYYKKNQSFW